MAFDYQVYTLVHSVLKLIKVCVWKPSRKKCHGRHLALRWRKCFYVELLWDTCVPRSDLHFANFQWFFVAYDDQYGLIEIFLEIFYYKSQDWRRHLEILMTSFLHIAIRKCYSRLSSSRILVRYLPSREDGWSITRGHLHWTPLVICASVKNFNLLFSWLSTSTLFFTIVSSKLFFVCIVLIDWNFTELLDYYE